MSRFSVEIESLVLEGFDLSLGEGRRVARLTETALARLLDQRGVASGIAARSIGSAPQQQIAANGHARGERLAEEIAQALYRALDRGN